MPSPDDSGSGPGEIRPKLTTGRKRFGYASALLFLAVFAVAAAALYWKEYPSTPAELYRKRCSDCHKLPDLSSYQRDELAPLVNFMRTHNGADRVITTQEARLIIQYLEQSWPIRNGEEIAR
jgi:hypothetical protein